MKKKLEDLGVGSVVDIGKNWKNMTVKGHQGTMTFVSPEANQKAKVPFPGSEVVEVVKEVKK